MSSSTIGPRGVSFQELAGAVEYNGVAHVAEALRERGLAVSMGRVGFAVVHPAPAAEVPPPSLASRLNVVRTVRAYFAEQSERRQVAEGLRQIGAGKNALTDERPASSFTIYADLRRVREGAAALVGTELEGCFPPELVRALHDAQHGRLGAEAAESIERLVGGGTAGLLVSGCKNFAGELADLSDRLAKDALGTVRRAAADITHVVLDLGDALKPDRTLDARRLANAVSLLSAWRGAQELEPSLRGIDRTMLAAAHQTAATALAYAEAYPDTPLPAADVERASRAVLWNSRSI